MYDFSVVVCTYNSDIDKLFLTLKTILIQKNITYEIVITDLAGNEKKLKFIVASEWVKKGVVPTGESVSLISDYEYKLGEGSWQLEGDATSYNGNITFYVVEEGEYVFSQQ